MNDHAFKCGLDMGKNFGRFIQSMITSEQTTFKYNDASFLFQWVEISLLSFIHKSTGWLIASGYFGLLKSICLKTFLAVAFILKILAILFVFIQTIKAVVFLSPV